MIELPQDTRDLLGFVGADHILPAATRANAVRLLGDTLAVGAAGVDAPGENEILQTARAMGSGTEARLIGTDERLPAPSAAFVNAYRIHCLEWDGVHEPAVVHALSVVTAALGAAIDRRGGCDPEEALVALVVGVDVASGLGLSVDTPLAFFRPSTAGTLAATIAVARFDGAPIDNALGLAYSSAAGTMQAHVEGSPALPFQIANAARAAIVASDLAKAGFSGPKNVLEGPFGWYQLFEQGELSRYTNDLGKIWRIDEISVKPYPSGRASHAALSTILDLALDPADIAQVELACPPLIRRLVDRPYAPDMQPAWARLCLPFLAALAITDGRIDPRRFTPENIADAGLAALAAKVRLVADANADPNALFPQTLRVTDNSGAVSQHDIANTLGSPQNPLSGEKAKAKYTLARDLAPASADARIFDDPLRYFTESP